MIRIFNSLEKKSIILNNSISMVTFQSNDSDTYNPHIIIELNGFHFLNHAKTCFCCRAFKNAIGNNSPHWFVEFSDKLFRLDLKRVGKEAGDNQLTLIPSASSTGTKLKINLDKEKVDFPNDKLSLLSNMDEGDVCAILSQELFI